MMIVKTILHESINIVRMGWELLIRKRTTLHVKSQTVTTYFSTEYKEYPTKAWNAFNYT